MSTPLSLDEYNEVFDYFFCSECKYRITATEHWSLKTGNIPCPRCEKEIITNFRHVAKQKENKA